MVAAEGSGVGRALAEHDVLSHCLEMGILAAAEEVQHAVGLLAAVGAVPVQPRAAAVEVRHVACAQVEAQGESSHWLSVDPRAVAAVVQRVHHTWVAALEAAARA